jgi:ERCC4-type nuclease
MKLHIDVRERQLIKLISALQKSENVSFDTYIKSLPLGDAIIVDDDDNELIMIERKSLSDLASSIIDGRYKEQSMRLDAEPIPNHNIMYVIEGSMDDFLKRNYSKRINENTLYSAVVTLNYLKGFSVIRTFTILETATWIIRLMDKLHRTKEKQGHYSVSNEIVQQGGENAINNSHIQQTQAPPAPIYSSVVKRVKKENIRPDNIGEIILSQIPGISTATSLAVMSHFGSLYNLMIELKKDRNCLNTLTYKTKGGQQRHISRKSIESIINYLLYQKETTIKVDT